MEITPKSKFREASSNIQTNREPMVNHSAKEDVDLN